MLSSVAETNDEEIALQALLSHDVRGSAKATCGLVGDQGGTACASGPASTAQGAHGSGSLAVFGDSRIANGSRPANHVRSHWAWIAVRQPRHGASANSSTARW
jgi:hypothetical protein